MRALALIALGLLGATNVAPPVVTGTAPIAPDASTNTPATNTPPSIADTAASLGLKEVSPGVLDYHGVKLDKKNHRISFPGTVNQKVGLIEYLLVNEKGK